MRKTTLAIGIALVIGASSSVLAGSEQREYRVYDPKHPVLPEYIVKERSDGTLGVYKPKEPLLPKYIIKDGKIYDPRKPALPLKEVEGGGQ